MPVTVLASACRERGWAHLRGADAVAGERGRIHGFAGFGPGRCDGRIWYFQGDGRTWRRTRTPYAGRVLAVAWDATGTYVLFAARDGLRIAKRTPQGVFTRGHLLSRPGSWEADLVVARGVWWAVWTDSDGLMQAKTYGRDLRRQRVTGPNAAPVSDMSPALAWRPGGGAVLAFIHYWESGGGSPIWNPIVVGSLDGHWNRTGFSGATTEPLIAVLTYGHVTYLAYPAGDRLLVASNESGRWRNRLLAGLKQDRGIPPRLAAGRGRLLVAWLGEANGVSRVVLAERRPRWSVMHLTPAKDLKALVMSGGRPTILATSDGTHRLYAITGSR